jgi:hypothetical protein
MGKGTTTMNVAYAIAAATLAGFAAMNALPAGPAADEPSCQTIEGVGYVCVDADADCTDGSCGASAEGEIGAAATDDPSCTDLNGQGSLCAEATPESGSVDLVFGAEGVNVEAHASYGVGA